MQSADYAAHRLLGYGWDPSPKLITFDFRTLGMRRSIASNQPTVYRDPDTVTFES